MLYLKRIHNDIKIKLSIARSIVQESARKYLMRREDTIALGIQLTEIWRNILGEDHPIYARSIRNLAMMYYLKGDYIKAELLFLQAVKIFGNALRETHPDYATSLNNLGSVYEEMGNYKKAEPFLLQAVEIFRNTLGETHLDYASSLDNLGGLYLEMGDYSKAESLLQKSLEIRHLTLGETHPDYATSLNSLANLYQTMGDYSKATVLLQQSTEIIRSVLGEANPRYASALNNLGYLYTEMGNYSKAESLFQKTLEIRRNAIGETHPDYAHSLNNLANMYFAMGDFSKVEPLLQQSLGIIQNSLGEMNPDYAIFLNNLANVHQTMGDYSKAESLLQKALEIRGRIFGETHFRYATGLHNLAYTYWLMGKYPQAKLLLHQALEITEISVGKEHLQYSKIIKTLANLYIKMGDYDQAESLFCQSIEINHKILGEQHPDYATCLNDLANLYLSTDKYDNFKAEPILRKAMEIWRHSVGEKHPDYVTSLSNLADFYQSIGDYGQAESLYCQSIDSKQYKLGKQHPHYAYTLSHLGMIYKKTGDYIKAETCLSEAMEIIRNSLGETHLDYAQSLKRLAILYVITNRPDQALDMLIRVNSINDLIIGQVFSVGSETQRMAYLQTIQKDMFLFLTYALQQNQSDVVELALNLALRRKSLGAEGVATQRDIILRGPYPELEPQLRQINILRKQIAEKTLSGPGREGLEYHQQLIAEWRGQQNALEEKLASQIPEMNLTKKLNTVTWQAISNALPKHSALVEFVRFDVYSFNTIRSKSDSPWQPARYLAFVIHANELEKITMIDLGEAEYIEHMIAEFRETIGKGHRGLFYGEKQFIDADSTKIEIGERLRKTLFDSLIPVLSDCHQLFLSPDGELNRLPFEILPQEDGQRLIDHYEFNYLSAGRDILRFGGAFSGITTQPVVIADPDFDLAEKHKSRSDDTFYSNTTQLKSRQSQELGRAGFPFDRLPGTRIEGEQIAGMLGALFFSGTKALEAYLKQHRSPRILHIATHGFFLPDQKPPPQQLQTDLMNISYTSDNLRFNRLIHGLENPLLRSGLALAGANTWAKGGALPAEAEDALLNGEDVSGMDLLGTELVVLSACETGLGEMQVGEGVLGLRRAFVLAGAKTLVLSLWKVPDKETQELMIEFYRRLLAGEARAEALRQTQLAMKAKNPDPYYWGAFICQGEPGVL